MAGLATKPTGADIQGFISEVSPASKQADARTLLGIFEEITGEQGTCWGNEQNPASMVGFGEYSYQRKGSKEVFHWFKIGFAPRKTQLTLYLMCDVSKDEAMLQALGKCKWGKGCVYINKLADVDEAKLKELIQQTWERNKDL
jgi:hypothetical protein